MGFPKPFQQALSSPIPNRLNILGETLVTIRLL